MAKLARLFLILALSALVTVSGPLIYLMSEGSKEMDMVMATQNGAVTRDNGGTPARRKSDAMLLFNTHHPPPSASSQTPPTTTSQTPPTTTSQSPPSTTSQTPPSTASQTPPSTASQTTPSTASQTPPSTASQTPPSTASQTSPSSASQTPPSSASETPPSTSSQTPPPTGTPADNNPWKNLIVKSAPFTVITPEPNTRRRLRPLPHPSNYKPEPHRQSKAGPTFTKDGAPYYPRVQAANPVDFDDVQLEENGDDNGFMPRDKVTGSITGDKVDGFVATDKVDGFVAMDKVGEVLEAQKRYQRILKYYMEILKQEIREP